MNQWRSIPAMLLLVFAVDVNTSRSVAATSYALFKTLVNPNTKAQADAHQGTKLALQDNIAVVASSVDDVGAIDSGVVKVYDITNGSLLHTLINPSPGASESFGASVAISGTRVVVGTPYDLDSAYAGTVYVYDLAGLAPTAPVLILTNPSPAGGDSFGMSVGISGEHIVVGAHWDDTGARDSGIAYVYDLSSIAPSLPALTLTNPTPAVGDWFAQATAIAGSYVAIGAQFDDTAAANAGTVYVYDLASANPVVPLTIITNPAPHADDRFGWAIAVLGTRLLVGAPYDDLTATNAGVAYVFDLISATPTAPILTLTNPNPNTDDLFGSSVAISKSHFVIGAALDDAGATDSGSAYVYDVTAATPAAPVLTLINPSPGDTDVFGSAVAISGSHVAISAHGDSSLAPAAGVVYVYNIAAPQPDAVVTTLDYPSPASSDWFGYSVAISGTRCVIGAPIDDTGATDAGIAYIYDLSAVPSRWPLLTLTNPSPAAEERFGSDVAIDGSHLIIGAATDSTGAPSAGIAYVYDLESAFPALPTLTLTNPSPARDDRFGHSLAISSRRAVVGAHNDSAGATFAGSAYVYDLTGLNPALPVLTLTNPSPQAVDSFAYTVALSGHWLVVGAPSDDAGALNAGSAYIYDLSSPDPAQVFLTLTNPTPAQSDSFGDAVAISGTRIVVSASGDDTGALNAGIAYVYDLSSPMPSEPVLTLSNPNPGESDYFGDSVAISGTRVVIGAPFADTGAFESGGVYVYDIAGANPTVPVAMFNNPTPADYDDFGDCVAIDGPNILVGAPSDDAGAYDRGAAFVFGPLPALSISRAAPGSVTISWTPAPSIFVLQSAENLTGSNWFDTPGGSTPPVTLPMVTQPGFYRLIQK
jgi:hypothetical protein